jgi:hypothetical protein
MSYPIRRHGKLLLKKPEVKNPGLGGAIVLLLLYLLGTGTLGDFIDLARAYFRH